jgi:iron complex outermembrane receptor protein
VQLDGAVFYSHLTDVIISVPFIFTSCTPAGVCTPNAVTQSRNVGKGDFYGLELSATAAVTDTLTLGGNYTLIHRDLKDPTNPAFEPTDVPNSKGFLYAEWRPVPRLRVLPNLDLATDRWTVNSAGTLYYQTGGYVVANLEVDYSVTDQLEVGLGGQNLTDTNYQLVDGFPEPGRSFFLRLRARY